MHCGIMSGIYTKSPFHGLQYEDLLMDSPDKFTFLSPTALQAGTLYDIRSPRSAMMNFYSHPFFRKTDSAVQNNPLDLSQKSTSPSDNARQLSLTSVSPYLGMSPALPSSAVNPGYGSSYLDKLRSNPMFHDLQMLLAQECHHMQVPTNLITPSWNPVHIDNGHDVYTRHIKLQEKLIKLRSDPAVRQPAYELESYYSCEVGKIEVARYQALCAASVSDHLRIRVNVQFDQQRFELIQNVEIKLSKLSQNKRKHSLSSENSSPDSDICSVEERQLFDSGENSDYSSPDLSFVQRRQPQPDTSSAPKVDFERQSRAFVAARQLSFVDDNKSSVSTAELSSEMCQPLSVSSEDSRSSSSNSPRLVIDVESDSLPNPPVDILAESVKATFCGPDNSANETSAHAISNVVHSVSPSCNNVLRAHVLNHENYMPTVTCQRDNFGFTSNGVFRGDESGLSYCDNSLNVSLKRKSPEFPCEDVNHAKRQRSDDGSSRLLNDDATDILTAWYNTHIRYPYPSDEEVQQLSHSTGLTVKQVKKWMANKRVRCYNTLSISGNQHPIKFKYKNQPKLDNNTMKQQPQQLSIEVRQILSDWFDSHSEHPYPSEEEKVDLAEKAGISVSQVRSWFANRRSRLNKTKKQVPNYFIQKYPEYSTHVNLISYQREQARRGSKHHHSNNSMAYFYPPYH